MFFFKVEVEVEEKKKFFFELKLKLKKKKKKKKRAAIIVLQIVKRGSICKFVAGTRIKEKNTTWIKRTYCL